MTIQVAAALIVKNGKFLACRRPEHKARGGLWEFVGGKLEPGETGEQALVRECKEELDITIRPTGLFASLVHEYPDITVELSVYRAEIVEGEPKLLEHSAMAWLEPRQTDGYSFCPADVEILEKIRQELS